MCLDEEIFCPLLVELTELELSMPRPSSVTISSTITQSMMTACTRIVEAEQLQDDEPPKSTFFNSSLQLMRNVLIFLCPDWSIQDRVEKSRAGAWFFTRVKKGPSLGGACYKCHKYLI